MSSKWNKVNINEFGIEGLVKLFSFRELATKTVEPNPKHKKGNKNSLDQDKIDLLKGRKI